MSKLEDYIKQHKQEFDFLEPSDKHFDKMKLRLGYTENNNLKLITNLLKYASVFLILLVSSYFLIFNKNQETCLPDNFIETQNYYVNLVNEKTAELPMDSLSQDEIDIINRELAEIDSTYNLNIKDICSNPNNDFVINSLVKHYEIKLRVINKILFKLNQTKKNKNNGKFEI